MTKEEYVGTITIRGTKIDIGSDDYGQQFFFEYEKDGEVKTVGCGTYNFEFIEYIVYYFDMKGFYISIYGENYWKDEIKRIEQIRDMRLKRNPDDKELEEHYNLELYHMKNDDYDLYNFDALYNQIGFER